MTEEEWKIVERAFYEGIIFCAVGSHSGGTTGALQEASEYVSKLRATQFSTNTKKEE